jgi:hypothetical protein
MVWCGRSYQINAHAPNTFFRGIFQNTVLFIIQSCIRLIDECVVGITAQNLSVVSNMDHGFTGLLRVLLFVDKLESFSEIPVGARSFDTFSPNSALF